MSEYIEAGKITSAHSFRGEVKIQSWCDTPEFLTRFRIFYLDVKGGSFLTVEKIRAANNLLIASFKEIDSEETAFKFKNKVLYIKKDDANLDEGTFFISDMIGLSVFDFDTGVKYGILSDVFNNGANDIYVVKTEIIEKNNKNKEVLIPNVPAFIKKVSLDEGVFITPIEGMF
ncbi:MAG: ribosome maturation factor RimM [Oscillospiraceae bacterium]|nr:ribosome maturation factor RimM [Oscillospiraceae bacterium]